MWRKTQWTQWSHWLASRQNSWQPVSHSKQSSCWGIHSPLFSFEKFNSLFSVFKKKFRVQIEEIFPGPNGFKHELIDCNIDPDQSSDLTDSLVDKTPDRQPVTQNNEVFIRFIIIKMKIFLKCSSHSKVIPSCPAIPRDMLSVPDTVIQLPAIILEEEEAASTLLQPLAANGIAQIESQHTARVKNAKFHFKSILLLLIYFLFLFLCFGFNV